VFSWVDVASGRKNVLRVELVLKNGGKDVSRKIDLDLKDIAETKTIAVGDLLVNVELRLSQCTKELVFWDATQKKSDDGQPQPGSGNSKKSLVKNGQGLTFQFEAYINKMGISLIGTKNDFPIEPIYIQFEKISFYYERNDQYLNYQFRVKSLQIDNNSSKYSQFPVLLTPTHPSHLSSNPHNHLINFSVKQKNILNEHL
jgi:hypothetical protein